MAERNRSWVQWLCIGALSVEWLGFGACHFIYPDLTEAQIPAWIPLKTLIVNFTGAVELIIGVLIWIPRTRKAAALVSLVLLFLFLPAIFNMMINDAGMPGDANFRNFVHVILEPNHIFLAMCALYLFRAEKRATTAQA